MPKANAAFGNNRSLCTLCSTATNGAATDVKRGTPCDYGIIPGFGAGKRECQVCSNFRSEDHFANWGHKCRVPKPPKTDFWEQYGRYTPDEYRIQRCQRCIELGNKYCDVDMYLKLSCSSCRPSKDRAPPGTRRPPKKRSDKGCEDWNCVLPGHPGLQLRARPNLVGEAVTWFRHTCPNCERDARGELKRLKNKEEKGEKWRGAKTDDDDNPNAVGCSWLVSRSAQKRPCDQCVKHGDNLSLTCKEAGDINKKNAGGSDVANHHETNAHAHAHAHAHDRAKDDADNNDAGGANVDTEPAEQAPKTWQPSVVKTSKDPLKEIVPFRRGEFSRIMCKPCADTGTKCYLYLTGNGTAEACQRCTQQGLNCIDCDENEWPIGSLAEVGFGYYGPFRKCDTCHAKGRNCDRQTPCDSCWKHNEAAPCRPAENPPRIYRNCLTDRLNPPPGPLYYLAIGYGPGGVDDARTGDNIHDWIGPHRLIYPCMHEDQTKTTYGVQSWMHAAFHDRNERRRKPPGSPPSINWKPTYAITTDDIQQMILSKWPDAQAPNEWLRNDPEPQPEDSHAEGGGGGGGGDGDDGGEGGDGNGGSGKPKRKGKSKAKANGTIRRKAAGSRKAGASEIPPLRKSNRLKMKQSQQTDTAADGENNDDYGHHQGAGDGDVDGLEMGDNAGAEAPIDLGASLSKATAPDDADDEGNESEYENVPVPQFQSALQLPIATVRRHRKRVKEHDIQSAAPPQTPQISFPGRLPATGTTGAAALPNAPKKPARGSGFQLLEPSTPTPSRSQPRHPAPAQYSNAQSVFQTLSQYLPAEWQDFEGLLPQYDLGQPSRRIVEDLTADAPLQGREDLFIDTFASQQWPAPAGPQDTGAGPSTSSPSANAFYDFDTSWIMTADETTGTWVPHWYVSRGPASTSSSWLQVPAPDRSRMVDTNMFIAWESGRVVESQQHGAETRNVPTQFRISNVPDDADDSLMYMHDLANEQDQQQVASPAPDLCIDPALLDPALLDPNLEMVVLQEQFQSHAVQQAQAPVGEQPPNEDEDEDEDEDGDDDMHSLFGLESPSSSK